MAPGRTTSNSIEYLRQATRTNNAATVAEGALKPESAMTFDEAGNHTLGCALHDDVRIEVVVLSHAAFAVADAQGRFRLPELPAGRATVVAYSPRLGEVSREIDIPDTGIAAIDLSF